MEPALLEVGDDGGPRARGQRQRAWIATVVADENACRMCVLDAAGREERTKQKGGAAEAS
ncbi:hypothetical protein VM57_12980 [Stenotrophomonas maltophilia]|uniref:Uncharacterized protein n=1 Tax=Stenotrophomonas maltophilia TaxID=40324 RepID=A0A0F5ZQ96_STEMA|nr:hypothetical protein VM57_12980 [Stenotrophomonas maltophilia]